jgi:hypothetical protein
VSNEALLLQLSTGLSNEYIEAEESDTARAADIAQADRDVCAKYYVQHILSLDEESIQDAWNKVSRACCTSEQGYQRHSLHKPRLNRDRNHSIIASQQCDSGYHCCLR